MHERARRASGAQQVRIRSRTCACRMEGASKCSPAAAVPVRTNIPEPMMAPMPSAVSDHGPKVFLSRCPGSSASEISLSMDLQQRTWWSEVRSVAAFWSVMVGSAKGFWSPQQAGLRPPCPGQRPGPTQSSALALRGAACHLLYFALGGAARVFTRLQRIFRLPLFSRCAFGFFAVFLAQCACICHECCD